MKIFNKEIEENFTENESFKKLIQYRTESVYDDKKIDTIDDLLWLCCWGRSQRVLEKRKQELNYRKNSVILFSLIGKLDRVTYIFNVSDNKLVEKYKYLSEKNFKEFDRESIDLKYNQDVRNYMDYPSEFLNYNIDTDFTNITIYKLEYDGYATNLREIEVEEENKLADIKKIIDTYNFNISDYTTDGTIEILIDFNNGYVIGIYPGSIEEGLIFKGTVEEYLDKENTVKLYVPKVLPEGLKQYVFDIISEE